MALLNLANGLADLDMSQGILADWLPLLEWDRDRTIVALFTEFTISLIPLVWIYAFAANFARWLLLFFAIIKLPWLLFALMAALWFADGAFLRLMEIMLLGITLGLVFRPSVSRWIKSHRGERA